jgi:LuxR family maltose regulon positive regulatory protein
MLVRVHAALGDMAGARTVMREIDDLFRMRPDLGTLVDEVADLRAVLATDRGPLTATVSQLTAAEIRPLPMLTTHLTYQEIADELFLSKHTIHSQVRSIFRKFGATGRSEAILRSQELALLSEGPIAEANRSPA